MGWPGPPFALVAAAGLADRRPGRGLRVELLQEDQQAADGGPVKVGLVVPQSGVYAPLGTDMQNGFRM